MCSTPFGINEVGTRHDQSLIGDKCGCSTPFGINEVGTAGHDHSTGRRHRGVLNAFRHQ